jgi:hypothetical protein
MLRTTGGLLEGQRKSITPDDFMAVVDFMKQEKFSDSVRLALGLQQAERYANAVAAHGAAPGRKIEVLDLERVSGSSTA